MSPVFELGILSRGGREVHDIRVIGGGQGMGFGEGVPFPKSWGPGRSPGNSAVFVFLREENAFKFNTVTSLLIKSIK